MRILQLRFKNLNSLAGEWLIDFTHPAFLADGIFAITGPTGAGKSTILDAMCLALYGRTPRLRNISKSSNEIMSRQTGECFAEVVFETHAGRFKCHWSQHRARKKAEGELQSPKHEIANADSGKILEAKIRGVAEQIEKATGMDFDRFTRSMLLAQGGFAAFLQADADQRAPILEQITGTEIYSQISIKVHELRTAETKKLDLLQAELAGMQLLSEEDETQLKENLDCKTNENQTLNEQLKQKNQAISWLEGIAKSEAELAILAEQQQDLVRRQQSFQPELAKLELAKQALELSADYAGLTALRNEQQRSQQALINHQQALPELDAKVIQATQDLALALSSLDVTKNEQKLTQIAIKKAREFDLKIQEKQVPIKNVQEAVVNLERQLYKVRIQQQHDNLERQQNQTKLIELTDLLSSHKTDEGLIEQLESIRNQFKSLAELAHQQQQKKNELLDAEQKNQEIQQAWQLQSDLLKTQQDEFEQISLKLTQYQTEQAQHLDSRSLSDWRQELSHLTERKTLLDKSAELMASLAGLKNEQTKLLQQHTKLSTTDATINEHLARQNTANIGMEREIQLLETQYVLQKKIESYEEARQHLHDGEPCPLCGANEHPYAQGNIPVLDETLANLNKLKSDLKINSEALANLRIQLAENQKDLQQTSLQQLATNKIISDETAILAQYFESLAIEGEVTNSLLEQYQHEHDAKFSQLTNIVREIENTEQRIVTEREAVDKKRLVLSEVDRQLQSVTHTRLMAEQAVERLTVDLANVTVQLATTQTSILADVAIYGVEELTIERLDETLQQLTARRDQWRTWQKDKGIIDPLIANLNSQIKHQAAQILTLESDLKIQQQGLSQLRNECDELQQQRLNIFADKNPDEEESRLITAVEFAEKNLESARQLSQYSEHELNKLKHNIETLLQEIALRNEQLNSAETDFTQRMLTVGFKDETEYKAACLSDEVRSSLHQQDQLLKNEYAALMARLNDKTTQLAEEREKQITEESLVFLKEQHAQMSAALNVLQQEIGGIRQKVADNQNTRLKQQSRVEQIEAQKRECNRWNTLHELIGSADGKKYRNFAQGLTFEMMIGHANRQLQKMTERYLLIRDEAQPLELNVVDNYQAGETRSTKNLSGGESFIVSLALALGLSQMASKNVRVDSLFLDEGFGTLDEEALDTALETLSGLQQEGKLIGVISHVQVLKERISTQIQITPRSGGRSMISGPGISSL